MSTQNVTIANGKVVYDYTKAIEYAQVGYWSAVCRLGRALEALENYQSKGWYVHPRVQEELERAEAALLSISYYLLEKIELNGSPVQF